MSALDCGFGARARSQSNEAPIGMWLKLPEEPCGVCAQLTPIHTQTKRCAVVQPRLLRVAAVRLLLAIAEHAGHKPASSTNVEPSSHVPLCIYTKYI